MLKRDSWFVVSQYAWWIRLGTFEVWEWLLQIVYGHIQLGTLPHLQAQPKALKGSVYIHAVLFENNGNGKQSPELFIPCLTREECM